MNTTEQCKICLQTIDKADPRLFFPNIVWNTADPIYILNDSSVHLKCFAEKYQEHIEFDIPEQYFLALKEATCSQCCQKISNYDDYFMLGCLSSQPEDPMSKYNFLTLHFGCVGTFRHLKALQNDLAASKATWRDSPTVSELLAYIRNAPTVK